MLFYSYMKQIGTQQFNSNDGMSLHRDMTAVKTLHETFAFHLTENGKSGFFLTSPP